jgi:cation transport ATPase
VENTPDRLTDLLIRINSIEQQIKQWQQQVQQLQQAQSQFVLTNVNDLHLLSIKSSADRIEDDIRDLKAQFADLSEQLSAQGTDAQNRETKQQQDQDQLKIRILWGIVSTIIGFLLALLVAYLTHFFH